MPKYNVLNRTRRQEGKKVMKPLAQPKQLSIENGRWTRGHKAKKAKRDRENLQTGGKLAWMYIGEVTRKRQAR